MTQKFVVGLLVLTVIGAVIIGVRDASRTEDDITGNVLAADVVENNDNVAGFSSDADTTTDTTADETQTDTATDNAADNTANTTSTTDQTTSSGQTAVASVGESWTGSGSINALDDNGMMLALSMAEVVYVELGPASFWQSLEPTLAVGDFVTVNGFYNGEQYHAATVTTANSEIMELRTELGQPMWAGNDSAANTSTDGTTSTTTEAQVAADEWVTMAGVVSSYTGSTLTMETTDGDLLDMQLGQQNFVASQGITFAVGDEISVLGYWQGATFKAGEITKTATSERLMLLDPNGRPLWGGPGRSGGANAQTQTQTNTTAQNQAQNSNQGSGQGSGQGNGGGQGQGSGQGQGNNKNQDVEVPAEQWETLEGTVTLVNDLNVTLALNADSENGNTAVVVLGQVDFWTEQGYTFEIGEDLQIAGYWVNGEFQAGSVSWIGTDYTITIRDQYGRLLWTATNQGSGQGNGGGGNGSGSGSGGGNGYQGGRNANFTRGNNSASTSY